MKTIFNYLAFFVFIIIGLLAFDGIKAYIKENFLEEDTHAMDIAKANIDKAFKSSVRNDEVKTDELVSQPKEAEPQVNTDAQDNYRNPALIRKWVQVQRNSTKGITKETYMTLFGDGTFYEETRTSMIIYEPGFEANSIGEFEPNQGVLEEVRKGTRWFSKGDKICFSTPGKPLDCSTPYYFEGNYLIVIWGGSNKLAYQRAN